MQQNTLLIIIAGVIALVGGVFVQSLPNKEQISSLPPTLEFSLPDLQGRQRAISEWQGKILIINFWATWCPPCLKEIPEFINLQNELNDKGLQFIGIAVEDRETIEQYLKTIAINYPILVGGGEAITLSQQLGNIINTVPFSIIVNKQGQIIHRHPGELNRDKIIEIITPLL